MSGNLMDESRRVWVSPSDNPSLDELQLGCLLRIATATELACKDREKLERDYRYMRDDRDRIRGYYDTSKRRNAALRGQITRLRRELAAAKQVTP